MAQCSGLQALLIFLNSCFFILGTQCYQSSYHGSCHGMGYGDSLFESEQSTKPGMSQCSPSSVDVGVRTKCQFLLQMSIQMSRTFEALSDETQLKYALQHLHQCGFDFGTALDTVDQKLLHTRLKKRSRFQQVKLMINPEVTRRDKVLRESDTKGTNLHGFL
ncbi:Protein CBG25181 [Caenorhabditis briggsae]|uniref:Protein CBG25181 n=1 Tax=Caenorhabditis briggsae TaxID=6238 RepID=B6IM06_CAEBR|nr:Protein CBG25181 [Caenorhabditis briggsae]CAS00936.1 Protein CBG25181 [Caenorhabditis briggsae]